jgi:hypothetical protein
MFQTLKIMFANDKAHVIQEKNRETITHLKFIAMFQPGEKINVTNLYIESNTIITPIKRMLLGESRDTTLNFINHTIERSFEIIQTLSFSEHFSEKMLCTSVISDLVKSVQGLKNIQKTYKDDKLFACNIDTIIDNIQAKLMELKLKKPELFPKEEEIVPTCEPICKQIDTKLLTDNKQIEEQLDTKDTTIEISNSKNKNKK